VDINFDIQTYGIMIGMRKRDNPNDFAY
jgi:hypothetical protein